jgi:gas vesicle protein GvpA/GvpJ/GvpM family
MAKRKGGRRGGPSSPSAADSILGTDDASLLDIVDNVLSKGVVLNGDITIGLAQVDLVYARLSVLLCAADRVLPSEDEDVIARHSKRHEARVRAGRR